MKLKVQWVYMTAIVALAVVLVVAFNSDGPIAPTASEGPERTPTGIVVEDITTTTPDGQFTDGSVTGGPPCIDGDCGPRNVSTFDLFSGRLGANSAFAEPDPAASVEDVLQQGLRLAEASPVYIAFRGTVDSGSVRCEWRGITRTSEQREAAIRFWLDLSDDDPLPSPEEALGLFILELDRINAVYPATLASNFQETAKSSARPPGLQTRIEYL